MGRVLATLVLAALATTIFAQQAAVIRNVSGQVETLAPGGQWTAALAGMRLQPGVTISTGFRSEAALEIGASTVRVRPLTRMSIDALLEREGTATSELFVRVGRVHAEVRTAAGLRQDFKVKSPLSTAAVRGTTFEYDGVNLTVDNGLVRLSNSFAEATSVGPGEKGTVTRDQPPVGAEANNESAATIVTKVGRSAPALRPPASTAVTIRWVRR